MDSEAIGKRIRNDVPRDVLIDLYDEIVAQTKASFECVRDHTGLSGKRARRADGFLRFLMNENAFELVALKHGGADLDGHYLPGTELVVFQPYKIFGEIVLGFATHIEPGELPTKNQTRRNAAQLNFDLSERFDLPSIRSKRDTIFVLLLISRDPSRGGSVREFALAVVDSTHDHFLFYETLEKFLSRYATGDEEVTPSSEVTAKKLVTLKKRPSEEGRAGELNK